MSAVDIASIATKAVGIVMSGKAEPLFGSLARLGAAFSGYRPTADVHHEGALELFESQHTAIAAQLRTAIGALFESGLIPGESGDASDVAEGVECWLDDVAGILAAYRSNVKSAAAGSSPFSSAKTASQPPAETGEDSTEAPPLAEQPPVSAEGPFCGSER